MYKVQYMNFQEMIDGDWLLISGFWIHFETFFWRGNISMSPKGDTLLGPGEPSEPLRGMV